MPFLEPAKVLSSLIRLANPRILLEPVSIRALSAIQSPTIRTYGTGKYINGESGTKTTEIPYPSNASRSGNSSSASSGLTDGGKGRKTAETQSREPQDTSEKAKIEDEDRAYQVEVEKHNQEFEKGYDRGHEKSIEPKDDEKFWKGTLRNIQTLISGQKLLTWK